MKIDELVICIKRKKVFSSSTEELKTLYAEHFVTKDEINNAEYLSVKEIVDKDYYGSEAEAISISELRKIIDKVEKAGANFISIDYHSDHGEYDVYGYHCERASQADIEFEEAKEAKLKATQKEAKIKSLEEELNKLKLTK